MNKLVIVFRKKEINFSNTKSKCVTLLVESIIDKKKSVGFSLIIEQK